MASAAPTRADSLTSTGACPSKVPERATAPPQGFGPRYLSDLVSAELQDLPLTPCRVIDVELGDLLEQCAPALVVEPLRRQPLRPSGESRGSVHPQARR